MAVAWDERTQQQQERVRDRILEAWLPEVLSFAPHWSRLAERLGLVPESVTEWGDLLRVPPSLQDQVAGSRAAGTSLVIRPTVAQVDAGSEGGFIDRVARAMGGDDEGARRATLLREYKPVQVLRGGRDGLLAIASSRSDLERQQVVGGRAALVLGLGEHDYLVSAVPAAPQWDFWGVRSMALGASMLALHPRGHGDDLDACTPSFRLMPTTAVAVRRDEAIAWAEQLGEADADVSRVVRVVVVGPPPDDELRGAILDAWRAAGALEGDLRVVALWAPSVSRSLWAECDGGDGLHVQASTELVELREAELPPLVAGAPARELVVTTLGWRGTALLRLRTGIAAGALVTEPCSACGRTLPRVTGPIVHDAWGLPLHGADGRDHVLDARALPGALGSVDAWSAEVVADEDHDGLVLHVAGYDLHAERLVDRVERHTGVRPDAVEVEDLAQVDRRRAEDGLVADPRD